MICQSDSDPPSFSPPPDAPSDRRSDRLAEEVRQAVNAYLRDRYAAAGDAALVTALGAYARQLKAEGNTPERMLVMVKALLQSVPGDVLSRLVSAAIVAYYSTGA